MMIRIVWRWILASDCSASTSAGGEQIADSRSVGPWVRWLFSSLQFDSITPKVKFTSFLLTWVRLIQRRAESALRFQRV
jgi:hypothetical protein